MTKIEKILAYLYNRSEQIDLDRVQHLHFMRFHKCDEVDYMEAIINKTRCDLINEITSDIMHLMGYYDKMPKNTPNYTK